MSKLSLIALKFSIERFVKTSDKVYLWTFTFEELALPKDAYIRWKRFTTRIKRFFPGLGGVRVFEWHPWRACVVEKDGALTPMSHGIHIHLITNMFLPVDGVRILSDDCFGRIHVIRCNDITVPEKLSGYLSKYLRKYMGHNCPKILKHARLWANWGSWDGTKVREVKETSCFKSFWKRLVYISENNLSCDFSELERFVNLDDFALRWSVWKAFKSRGALMRCLRIARMIYDKLEISDYKYLDHYFQEQTVWYGEPAKDNEPF